VVEALVIVAHLDLENRFGHVVDVDAETKEEQAFF
jgi:hypothetical protein